VNQLIGALRGLRLPEAVTDQGSDQNEQRQHQRRGARLEPQQDRETSQELGQPRQKRQRVGDARGKAVVDQIGREAGEPVSLS
jgi:hypothetical protein